MRVSPFSTASGDVSSAMCPKRSDSMTPARRAVRFGMVIACAALATTMTTVTPAGAQEQPAPIPDMYIGGWERHGTGITISRSDFAPEQGNALMEWRTYTWCQDPITQKPSPPPCDSMIGNTIGSGASPRLPCFTQPARMTSNSLASLPRPRIRAAVASGAHVEFTMLLGNMLLMQSGNNSTMFCGQNTDLSLYPPNPCGA